MLTASLASSSHVFTPGDSVDVLVAMNPAALKTNIADLRTGGILIVNSDSFGEVDFKKAKITSNPLLDGSLSGYRVFPVDLLKLTKAAVKDVGLDAKSVEVTYAIAPGYYLSREQFKFVANGASLGTPAIPPGSTVPAPGPESRRSNSVSVSTSTGFVAS